jgi:hypothetical protein
MLSVRAADVFDAKAVNNQRERDGSCRMGDKAGSVLCSGISVFGEMLDEPFIGNDCC